MCVSWGRSGQNSFVLNIRRRAHRASSRTQHHATEEGKCGACAKGGDCVQERRGGRSKH